jgi:hypothetical protein
VILPLALIAVSIACRTGAIEATALEENIARHAQEAVWHEFSWYGCAASGEGRKSSRQHSDLVN